MQLRQHVAGARYALVETPCTQLVLLAWQPNAPKCCARSFNAQVRHWPRTTLSFTCPPAADDLTAQVPAGSVDACTMIFVLSAIAPAIQQQAIRRVAATLRPEGRLLFRCGPWDAL